jgi:hypothetical protein
MTSSHPTWTPARQYQSSRDGETKGTALAPSQHHHPTWGKPRTARRAFPVVLLSILLGATLALSACGAQESSAAAIINGTSISDKDVQGVTDQLNILSQGGQKLSPSNTLLSLILAPYVLAEAKRVGKTVSESQARQVIAKISDPSPATITFVRMQLALQGLDQASRTAIVSKLGKAKITINPRYGTLDTKRIAMTPTSPNWIKASTASPAK